MSDSGGEVKINIEAKEKEEFKSCEKESVYYTPQRDELNSIVKNDRDDVYCENQSEHKINKFGSSERQDIANNANYKK